MKRLYYYILMNKLSEGMYGPYDSFDLRNEAVIEHTTREKIDDMTVEILLISMAEDGSDPNVENGADVVYEGLSER